MNQSSDTTKCTFLGPLRVEGEYTRKRRRTKSSSIPTDIEPPSRARTESHRSPALLHNRDTEEGATPSSQLLNPEDIARYVNLQSARREYLPGAGKFIYQHSALDENCRMPDAINDEYRKTIAAFWNSISGGRNR